MPNLSQIKRKRMLEFLDKIKEEHKNDDEMLIALGEIENELNSKKYGLVWEEHEEKVDVQMRTHIPVFTEVKEREIAAAPEQPYNFLLEGDNLHSLYLLEKTHKGAIDLIYIDPPYNTGHKDFVYDDAFVDKQDGYSHSKWISFINERLRLAKSLLKPAGTIFISIDDNEYANLKLLCDSVFDERNFISCIIWNSRKSVSNDAVVSLNHNYTLVYTHNIDAFYKQKAQFKLSDTGEGFANPDNDPRGAWKADPFDSPGIRPNLTYKIVNPNTGAEFMPPAGRCWRTGQKEYEQYLADNRIVFGKNGTSKPQLKRFLSEAQDKGLTPKSIWDDCGTATDGTRELQEIFGSKVFDTPKPSSLIKKILDLAGNRNSTVLDFFAGSGTTAQAVLELNKEDGGNRRFILCTNNESQICDNVTYPRIKTVITGKRPDGSTYSDGIPANLKYYRTDSVARDEEFLSDALLEHIAEMIQLEHGVKIDGSGYRMIMSDEEADYLFSHADELAKIKALYISKNVLLTTEQREKLSNTEIHIIPDDYFLFELREEAQL